MNNDVLLWVASVSTGLVTLVQVLLLLFQQTRLRRPNLVVFSACATGYVFVVYTIDLFGGLRELHPMAFVLGVVVLAACVLMYALSGWDRSK